MDSELKKNLTKIAGTIRGLAMDGVQKANSGHPGLPMGCAEIGAYLYGHFLKHHPKNPKWLNRDRFILSAGHGSMLLYSCLHLAGFKLSLEDLKNFRQLHSKTPGHPEYRETEGVETTTGPLGQGVGNAVGQALSLKLLEARLDAKESQLFNAKVICLAGDGCMMEGVSSEVSSFAANLNLNNLILIYDSNHVCLDGPTSECLSEDTKARYKAYGWDVFEIDGNDLEAIDQVLSGLRAHQERPAFIVAHTIIGKGSPHKAGTSKAHGAPLGAEEVAASKAALGLPPEDFYVPQAVKAYFEKKVVQDEANEMQWNASFGKWGEKHPEQLQLFQKMQGRKLPSDLEDKLKNLPMKSPLAGRSASQEVLNLLGDLLPFLYGGSADLSCSDLTMMKEFPIVTPSQFNGRNIKYGVREFGMATIASGLTESEMILPYVGTFLTFSDYMRNAIRLASLMKVHVIYQFTHDSIFLGEDGPTHQPVEHYAALRAIPNLHVIRPGDNNEVKMAWIAALKYQGPTALLLSRQNLPEIPSANIPYAEGMGRGAYIVKQEKAPPQFTILATGSELSLALDVAQELEKIGKNVRVISMPCWELFEQQPEEYKKHLLGGNLGKKVCIEAGISQGWHKYIGSDGIAICQETFGASAPASALAKEFGFTVEEIMERLLSHHH